MKTEYKGSGMCRHPHFPLCQKSKVSLPLPSFCLGRFALLVTSFHPNGGTQSQIRGGLALHRIKVKKCWPGGWVCLTHETLCGKWSFLDEFLVSVNVSQRVELEGITSLRTYSQFFCSALKAVLLIRFVSIPFGGTSFPSTFSPSQGEHYPESCPDSCNVLLTWAVGLRESRVWRAVQRQKGTSERSPKPCQLASKVPSLSPLPRAFGFQESHLMQVVSYGINACLS